jgi:hypothetical protein
VSASGRSGGRAGSFVAVQFLEATKAATFASALGARFPLAQKNGWFSSVRHTAAILYATDGPRIAVLFTYRPGVTRVEAGRLGGKLIAVALGT